MWGTRRGDVWVKRPDDLADATLLQRERDSLMALAHPGISELVRYSEDPPELHLRPVDGVPLASLRLPAQELAGLAEAVLSVVGDLHNLGWTHGAVSADHILVDRSGRPVLCSLGRARFHRPGPSQEDRRRDVAGLATALVGCLSEEGLPRTHRRLTKALRRAQAGKMSAKEMLQAIRRAVPDAALPDLAGRGPNVVPATGPLNVPTAYPPDAEMAPAVLSPSPTNIAGGRQGGSRSGRAGALILARRWLVIAGLGTAAALLAVAAAKVVLGPPGAERPALAGPAGVSSPAPAGGATFCPPEDGGCRPLPMSGTEFSTPTGSWNLGQPGDVVVLGRWTCHDPATPAVLQPATGRVWLFDSWSTGSGGERGRLLATIPDARSLVTVPGTSACDRLAVVRDGHRLTVLAPGGR